MLRQAINATRGMNGQSKTCRTKHAQLTSPDYAQNDLQKQVYIASRNNRFSLAKQQQQVPYLTSLIHSLHNSQKYMDGTPVNMTCHSSKHMQSSCSQDAHTKCNEKDKSPSYNSFSRLTSYSTLVTMIQASIWTQTNMAQWNEMQSISWRTF